MARTGLGARRWAGMATAVAGMLLIGATYGMARFGVGLFAPMLATERPGLVQVLGWAAAAQFISYSLAALAAAKLVRRSPRTALAIAGTTATFGCLGLALTSDPALFVAAVLVGGMGAGFASPALVPLVDAAVAPAASATAQSVTNAGTAVGVIGAGLVSFAATSIAPAWIFMALACALTAGAVGYSVRARPSFFSFHSPAGIEVPTSGAPGAWRELVYPGMGAVIVGAGSSLAWTFGPLLITGPGPLAPEFAGWLWISLGLGGLLGMCAGVLVTRVGLLSGWRLCACALALSAVGIALTLTAGSTWLAFAAMALFGASYMVLSGILILWARSSWPTNPGAGTSFLFIALASGQALGSAGFGVGLEFASPIVLALIAAGLCVAGAAIHRHQKP